MSYSASDYMPVISSAATEYGVPEDLLTSLLGAESGFDPNAYNPSSGAAGIAQFDPATAAQFGIDPYDPTQSINASAQYLAQLQQEFGSWSDAVQAYGPVPTTNDLTGSQSNVLNVANNDDLSQGYIDPSTGQYVPPYAIPNPANPGYNMEGGKINQGVGGFLGGIISGVEGWFARGAIGAVAVVIIVIGAAALVWHSGDVQKAAKSLYES